MKKIYKENFGISAGWMESNSSFVAIGTKDLRLVVLDLAGLGDGGVELIGEIFVGFEVEDEFDGIGFIEKVKGKGFLVVAPTRREILKVDFMGVEVVQRVSNPLDRIGMMKMGDSGDFGEDEFFVAASGNSHVNFVGDQTTLEPLFFFSLRFFYQNFEESNLDLVEILVQKDPKLTEKVDSLDYYGYYPKSQYYVMANSHLPFIFIFTTVMNKLDDVKTVEGNVKHLSWVEHTAYIFYSTELGTCGYYRLQETNNYSVLSQVENDPNLTQEQKSERKKIAENNIISCTTEQFGMIESKMLVIDTEIGLDRGFVSGDLEEPTGLGLMYIPLNLAKGDILELGNLKKLGATVMFFDNDMITVPQLLWPECEEVSEYHRKFGISLINHYEDSINPRFDLFMMYYGRFRDCHVCRPGFELVEEDVGAWENKGIARSAFRRCVKKCEGNENLEHLLRNVYGDDRTAVQVQCVPKKDGENECGLGRLKNDAGICDICPFLYGKDIPAFAGMTQENDS